MGQKTSARLLRLNIVEAQKSHSNCFADRRHYAKITNEDRQIYLFFKKFSDAGIAHVNIERTKNSITVIVTCSRPAVMIGRKGSDVESIKKQLSLLIASNVQVKVKELKRVDLHAKLVGEGIARQLEKRVAFRKAIKRAASSVMRSGALGVRIKVSGRLGGAEIARSEECSEGRVPLHTLKADIDYYIAEALTTYGIIGIKVWVYRPDNFEKLSAVKKRRRDDSEKK